MSTSTTRGARVAGVAEKTILGVIAGASIAIGIVDAVFAMLRIVELGRGPVTLTGVPLNDPRPAGFAGATFDTVALQVADLSAGGRAALMGATAASALLVVGICAVLAWLCVRVFLGRPFVASATWGIGIVAILVLVSGMLGPLLTGIGNAEAAAVVGGGELPLFLFELDLAPLGWGFALAVVAGAFELGQRLQRDTEGLV